LGAQEGFGFQMILAGGPARADGDELAGVFEGFGAVEVRLGGGGEGDEEEQSKNKSCPELLIPRSPNARDLGHRGFVISHPSRKNKNAARVGHP
jgi:hypothetical protein